MPTDTTRTERDPSGEARHRPRSCDDEVGVEVDRHRPVLRLGKMSAVIGGADKNGLAQLDIGPPFGEQNLPPGPGKQETCAPRLNVTASKVEPCGRLSPSRAAIKATRFLAGSRLASCDQSP